MAIQRLLSGWDYLGEAFNNLGQGMRTDAEMDMRRRQFEEQTKASERGFLSQLFQAGALDAEDFNRQVGATGMAVNAQPNAAELRRRIAAKKDTVVGGIPGIAPAIPLPKEAQTSEVDYEIAGLATPTQRRAARTAVEGQEVDITGKRTDQQNEARMQAATGFVSSAVNALGRAPTHKDAKGLEAQAWIEYSRSVTNPDPEVRKFIAAAVDQKITAYAEMLNARTIAGIRTAGSSDDSIRWATQVRLALDNAEKRLSELAKDTRTRYFLSLPEDQLTPFGKQTVDIYRQAEAKVTAARNALSTLAQGQVPPNIGEILAGLEQDSGGASGATQQGSATGINEVNVNRTVELLNSGKITVQNVNDSKTLTAVEKAEVKRRAKVRE